uniref:Uncharacterized protein n=1 Tax=Timema cristinae TaxID=61476 RepID=A0A7R9D2K8_TIMCR|nr:unnamed protein product [Timema cristinae]
MEITRGNPRPYLRRPDILSMNQKQQVEQDDLGSLHNFSTIIHPDTNTYLHEIINFWPYNDTYHVDKLDDFDPTHFDDSREVGIFSTERIPSRGSSQSGSSGPGTRSDPVFDNNLVTNVTAQLGGTAFLRCRVRNLGERPGVAFLLSRELNRTSVLVRGIVRLKEDDMAQVRRS